jgi:hypothetical protein
MRAFILFTTSLLCLSTVIQAQPIVEEYVMNLPYEELSDAEYDALILMREEEKLARDVYLTLHDTWDTNIFINIAGSEQAHTDLVALLLVKYELNDPFIDEIGVFDNPLMQELFDQLVALGNQSLAEGLYVGCTIEDLDIYDLYEFIAEADNRDIRTVYQNLVKGSRNHMRAFNGRYEQQGLTYEVQFISQEELDLILSSPHETGAVDENGDPLLPCTDYQPLAPQNLTIIIDADQMQLSWDSVDESVAGCPLGDVSYVIYAMDGSGEMSETYTSIENHLNLELSEMQPLLLRTFHVRARYESPRSALRLNSSAATAQ